MAGKHASDSSTSRVLDRDEREDALAHRRRAVLARRAIGMCAPACRLLIDVCRGKMFSRASSLCSALRAVRALARADRDRRHLHGADAGAWGARDLGGSRRRSRAGGACGNVDVNRLSLSLVLARRSAHAVPSLHSPRRRPAGGARTASRRARRVARGERSAGARESSGAARAPCALWLLMFLLH